MFIYIYNYTYKHYLHDTHIRSHSALSLHTRFLCCFAVAEATLEGTRLPGRNHSYPLVGWHNYGKSPCLIGKSTIHGNFQ